MSYWDKLGQRSTRNSGNTGDLNNLNVNPSERRMRLPREQQDSVNQTQQRDESAPTASPAAMAAANADKTQHPIPPEAQRNAQRKEAWTVNPQLKVTAPNSNQQQPLDPLDNSTPMNSPTGFNPRRLPTGAHEPADEDEFFGFETPSVERPRSDSRASSIVIPENAQADEVLSVITNLSNKIENFGSEFQNKGNWKDEFENYAEKIKEKLTNLTRVCMAQGQLDELSSVYTLTGSLEKHLTHLRAIAQQEQETPRSHLQLPPSSRELTAPDTLNENEENEDEGAAATGEEPPVTPTLKEMAHQWKIKMDNFTKNLDALRTLSSAVQALDASKATKAELEQACQRICTVETVTAPQLEKSIIDTQKQASNNSVAIATLRNLAQGFCTENVKLQGQLEGATGRIANLENEIQTLKCRIPGISQPQGQAQTYTHQQNHNPAGTNGNGVDAVRAVMNSLPAQNTQANTAITMHQSAQNPGFNTQTQQPAPLPPQTQSQPAYPPGIMPNSQDRRNYANAGQQSQEHLGSHAQGDQGRQRGQRQRRVVPSYPLSSSENTTVSGEEYLSRLGYRLKCAGRNLQKNLKPAVNDQLTRTDVKSIHKSVLPAVDADRKNVEIMIDRYDSQTQPCPFKEELLDEMDMIVEQARTWSREMRHKFLELDCLKQPLDDKLYEGLKRFSEKSEMNIFQFLSKFESLTEEKGTAKQRAELLFERYLDNKVQMLLIEKKENYPAMRQCLINRYGDVKVMTENIVNIMAKDSLPADHCSSANLADYYRKLNSVFKKIQELLKTADMPTSELEDHIYSNTFLQTLIAHVPHQARDEFYSQISEENLLNIKGKPCFSMLSKIVYRFFCRKEADSKLELSAPARGKPSTKQQDRDTAKPKKQAHSVREVREDTSSSEGEIEHSIHFQKTAERKDKKSKQAESKKSSKSFKFPCCLKNHEHELGECPIFFTKDPKYRKKCATRQNCFTCLGPFKTCNRECKVNVPKNLICKECKDWADQNNYSPLNIILCTNKDHTKPAEKVLVESLKKYLKNFEPGHSKDALKLTAHFFMSAHSNSACSCKSLKCNCHIAPLTRKPDPKEEIPVLDTVTGRDTTVSKDKIIPESNEDSIYIMQMLKMRGQDVLTFYDRGANQHLIDGELAENINLKVVSDEARTLGVVGGGKICTKYGTYAVILGPNEDGCYFEISAGGMENITQSFPKYDLSSINKQVRASENLPTSNEPLPKYVGGQKTRLLIGINNTSLDPELMFQLPNGMGVYKSPLPDIFGSRYCYGGPHKLIAKANKRLGGNFNHVSVFFTTMVNSYLRSPYPALARAMEPEYEEVIPGIMMAKQVQPSSKITTVDKFDLYPSAVCETDLQEMGIKESEPSELQQCICTDQNCKKPVTAVHKAKIPVAKRKEYIDAEDQGQIDSFRCDDHPRCKKCSLSDKGEMMSLQEKMEQEAMKKPTHVNLEENKVYVDLPFIKPPVEALVKKHNGADNNFKQAARIYNTQCGKPEQDVLQPGFGEINSNKRKGRSLQTKEPFNFSKKSLIMGTSVCNLSKHIQKEIMKDYTAKVIDTYINIVSDKKLEIPCIFTDFRFWGQDTLSRSALDGMMESRSVMLNRHDPTRQDLFLVHEEDLGSKYAGNAGVEILTKFIGKPTSPGSAPDRDASYMRLFLEKNSESALPKLTNLDLTDYLPNGSPLIYHLMQDNEATTNTDDTAGSYRYPTNAVLSNLADHCSVDKDSARSVKIKEITLGISGDEYAERVFDWASDMNAEDHLKFPTQSVSMHVETIKIPKPKYDELKAAIHDLKKGKMPQDIIFEIPKPGDDTIPIPARILIGNGITWMLSLRFNWDITSKKDGTRCYKLSPTPKPNALKFLNRMYIGDCIGYRILDSVDLLRNFVKDIFGMTILDSNEFVELEAIAIAAGWKLDKSNLFQLNLITLGGILNMQVAGGDQAWALDMYDLPKELLIYQISVMRAIHSTTIVLLAMWMRNIFPDIYALCSTLEVKQKDAILWFNCTTLTSLRSTYGDPDQVSLAETRQELIMSLKPWNFNELPWNSKPRTSAVSLLAKLIPDWSTITYGGARYIHPVLGKFTEQVQTLQEMNVSFSTMHVRLNHTVDDNFIRKITYNRGLQQFQFYEGTEEKGLLCQPDLKPKLANLSYEDFTDDDLAKAFKEGQARVLGILEIARLDIYYRMLILQNLAKADLDDGKHTFWLQKTRLYEELRNMHTFIMDTQGPVCKRIEKEIEGRQRNSYQQEVETRKKDERVVENRKAREQLYQINQSRSITIKKRTGSQQQIYAAVPGDHTTRNQRAKRSKKKMYNRMKNLPDYIPYKEWKEMKKKGEQPIRASSKNVREEGLDLRDVLKNRKLKMGTSATDTQRSPKRDIGMSPKVQRSPQRDMDSDPSFRSSSPGTWRRVRLVSPENVSETIMEDMDSNYFDEY